MDGSQIPSWEGFLNYGPIGLVGLMLVLVINALKDQALTEVKANLLKFYMVVGGICFAIAVAAEVFVAPVSYQMNVAVLPDNLAESPHTAPPALKIDGEDYDHANPRNVDKDFSILIDLNSAVDNAEAVMEALRAELVSDLEALETRTSQERAVLEQRLERIAAEIETFEVVQEVLSDLQSDAPTTQVVRISLQLKSELQRFMANLEDAVN